MFEHAAAWLLTYALHSTLLLALAWLASGPLSRRSLRLEEAVWRVALLGALATSTFQVATGWHPVAALRLPAAEVAAMAPKTAETAPVAAAPVAAPTVSPFYKEEPAAPVRSVAPLAAALEIPTPATLATPLVAEPSRPRPVWRL